MIRFLADEDLDGRIVRGLRRRMPELDVLRIQEAGLRTFHDRKILEYASQTDRVLISHDIRTMSVFAFERIAKGMPMTGVILIPQDLSIRQAIDELALIAECMASEEWNYRVGRLPLL